jgi:hypothetical protein
MGQKTQFEIEQWQRRAGLQLPTGEQAEALDALSQEAFAIIKLIELERSGIRDGDSAWHGSDVINGMTSDLMERCRRVRAVYGLDQPPEPVPEELIRAFDGKPKFA